MQFTDNPRVVVGLGYVGLPLAVSLARASTPRRLAHRYDVVIAAVGNREYRKMAPGEVAALARNGALLADLNGIWRDAEFPETLTRWSL